MTQPLSFGVRPPLTCVIPRLPVPEDASSESDSSDSEYEFESESEPEEEMDHSPIVPLATYLKQIPAKASATWKASPAAVNPSGEDLRYTPQIRDLGNRAFIVHAGEPLLKFLQLEGPEAAYNFRIGKLRWPTASATDTLRLAAHGELAGKGLHRLRTPLQLTATGEELLRAGIKDRQAFSVVLHCAGQKSRGKHNGSNCHKNPGNGKWCSSTSGECEAGCTWDGKAEGHACRVTIAITATVEQVAQRRVRVHIRGEHTSGGAAAKAVDPIKLTPSVFVIDAVRGADSGGQASRCQVRAQLAAQAPAEGGSGRHTLLPKQISEKIYYQRRRRHGGGMPTFAAIHHSISKHFSDPLPSEVIILHYFSEPEGLWQLVVTTEKALDTLRDPKVDFLVSDTKWDTNPQKMALSIIGAVLPDRAGLQPLVVSLSSRENRLTTVNMAHALEGAAPCGPDCRCEWMEGRHPDGTRRRWRACAIDKAEFTPMVGIDKSEMARGAFTSIGWRVSVCFFHNIRATLKNLEQLLEGKKRKRDEAADIIPQAPQKKEKHPILAYFDKGLRLLMTSQSEEQYIEALKALLEAVERWGERGWLGDRTPTSAFISYLKRYFSRRWMGTMGNYVGQGINGYQATNNSAESSFRVLDSCLLFGKRCTSFSYLLELLLGVTADWTLTNGPSYFKVFDILLQDKEGVIRRTPAENRRLCNGRWIHLQEGVRLHHESGGVEWYLVRNDISNIAVGKASETPVNTSFIDGFDPDEEFYDIIAALEPAGIPFEWCHYAVGVRTAENGTSIVSCVCEDFYFRGNTHGPCKHGIAALAFKETEEGGDGATRQQRQSIMNYLKSVEQGKADKDQELYEACAASDWGRVHGLLTSRRRRAVEQRSESVEIVVPVGVESSLRMTEIHNRLRTAMPSLPVGTFVYSSGKIDAKCSLRVDDIIMSVTVGDETVTVDSPANAMRASSLLSDASAERRICALLYRHGDHRRPDLSANASNVNDCRVRQRHKKSR